MAQALNLAPNAHNHACPNPKGKKVDRLLTHNMHYTEWPAQGTERGVVVCVHGMTRNGRDFDFLACSLANAGYRVICPDVVGRGKSPWLSVASWYNYALYVSDIVSLLRHLDISRCHWVGTSMGGIIGMMMEASMPHLIDKMVLNDIGPFIPKDALAHLASYITLPTEFASEEEAKKAIHTRMADFGIHDEATWQHVLRHSIEPTKEGFRLAYDPAIGNAFKNWRGKVRKKMPDMDFWPMFRNLNANIILLRGAQSGLLLKRTAEEMLTCHQVHKLVEFENVGHAPMLISAEQQAPILEFFTAK